MAIHIGRRKFLATLGGAAAAWPLAARAQQPAKEVIGFLNGASPESFATRLQAFREGLSSVGYIEGHNVAVDYRWGDGHYERLPALAADLVRYGVAAIAAASVDAAHAAKTATTRIPIVFFMSGDPVTEGLVTRLNQPEGNLTGVTTFSGVLTLKRLELLQELLPTASIVALINPNNSNAMFRLKEVEEASRTLALVIQVVNASGEDDIDVTFARLLQGGVGALLVVDDPLFGSQRTKLIALAAHYRIPAIYFHSEFVKAGGLISYGSDYAGAAGFRQVGIYTSRILKGAKPGDLPVVQPTKFELVINLRTAKALGLTVPQSLLARADEVIE